MNKLHLTFLTWSCRERPQFSAGSLQSSPWEIGKMVLAPLCFSLRYLKNTLFWGTMSFIWVQISAPTADSHFYSSAVTEISYCVKFIMPRFLFLWGNTFKRTYSGPCIKRLWESHLFLPADLNCSNRWHIISPQNVPIYSHQSCLLYQLDKYTRSPAVGSTNPCITNSSWIIIVTI